ncbi:glycine oxidase ThiO [Methylosoma difficile]
MQQISEITIIGGGVIGLMTARELYNAGVSVTVIDKNALGRESSWAGGGILLPLYPWRQPEAISRLVMQSLKLYPNLANQLLEDTGLDPEWTPCGLLITKNPDYSKAISWCENQKIHYGDAQAAQLAPFSTETKQPLWLPDIAQARNPRLLKSLKQDLINKGVPFIEHCQINGFTLKQQRITALQTNQGEMPVNQLVVASGAWTGQLFASLPANHPINNPQVMPVKGQMLLFDATPETLPYMVLDGDRYLIPRRDGKILAGSTVEREGFDKTITTTAKEQLHNFATELMPALKQFSLIHHWAGLRPGTTQGIPYICKHPDIRNLSINAGHFRNGLVMAPASAQLLVDILIDRPIAIPADAYQLDSPH